MDAKEMSSVIKVVEKEKRKELETVKFRVDVQTLARIDAMRVAAGHPTRAAYLLDCALAGPSVDLTEIARGIGRLGHLCNLLLLSDETFPGLSVDEDQRLARKIIKACDEVIAELRSADECGPS